MLAHGHGATMTWYSGQGRSPNSLPSLSLLTWQEEDVTRRDLEHHRGVLDAPTVLHFLPASWAT